MIAMAALACGGTEADIDETDDTLDESAELFESAYLDGKEDSARSVRFETFLGTDGKYYNAGGIVFGDGTTQNVASPYAYVKGTDPNVGEYYSIYPVGGSPTVNGYWCVIGGGTGHTALNYAVVGGGKNNNANCFAGTISGGYNNYTSAGNGSYGYSTVGGGRGNAATADYSTVSGGNSNTASASYSAVGGGRYNAASAVYSTVGGGKTNTASGSYSTVSGGNSNTASAVRSTVSGGSSNTASGSYSAVGGGRYNTVSGGDSVVAGGGGNNASAYYSTIGGGKDNIASGYLSTVSGGAGNYAGGAYSAVLSGKDASAGHYGAQAHASGKFSSAGDAQRLTLIARAETAYSNTPTEMFLDGASERMVIPVDTAWNFDIKLSMYSQPVASGGAWNIRGAIYRNGMGTTVLLGSNIYESWLPVEPGFAVSVDADITNNALRIQVTGLAGYGSQRWVAVVDIAQASAGTP